MAKENQLIEFLKRMKAKLKSQEMSVMVGAGFSKNVNNDLYPSWWQLLADMVLHMHGKKFEAEYKQIRPVSKRPNRKKFLENKINVYIDETGPLKVASKYMDSHGFRESIDTYIELRTPYIVSKENKKYLRHFVGENIEDLLLSDDDLSAHRKLVNLPWNNIYTTNYDNLLEKCIDENVEKEISLQIGVLENTLNELEEKIILNNKRRDELEKQLNKNSIKEYSDKSILRASDTVLESNVSSAVVIEPEENSMQASAKLEVTKLESEIEFLARQILQQEKELSRLRSLLKSCPSVVIRSSQLALKRTRNVIKLHGSRRTEENNTFGFDDDARKQYVITQDDFDSYPTKHEAFTQLMRISLLQESFCLVGFSGVDPNFLAWIGWVRDVLFKDKEKNKTDFEEKIYLVSPSRFPLKDEPDYGRSTFYQNQKIANIPLLEDVCIDFLEKETRKKLIDRTSRKGVLNLLFDYLQSETFTPSPELALEVSHRTKFNQLCESLPHLGTIVTNDNIDNIINGLSPIEDLKRYNRFPSVAFPYDFKRQLFLYQTEVYLPLVENDPEKLKIYLKAVSFFLQVQLYPQSIFYDDNPKILKKLENLAKDISPTLYGEFLLLNLKDAIWYDDERKLKKIEKELSYIEDKNIAQERQYLMALNFLLRLKFDKLEVYLSKWEAVDYWIVKKAGLLSHLDTSKATKLLFQNGANIIQEHLYELELHRYLEYSYFQLDSQNNERYKYLKESGLHTIQNSSDYLINEIKEKPDKILPYGEGKHTVTRRMSFSNTNKDLQSMQLVGLMLDSGYPFSTYESGFSSTQKVYQAMVNTLKYRWLPVIQSVLQYDDSKFTRRMAQDFTMCSYDLKIYQKVSDYLQDAYLNKKTPYRYKENIIVFLSELINIVHPERWQAFFIVVWGENLTKVNERSNRKSVWDEYVNKALPLIQKPSSIGKVIIDCLNLYQSQNGFDGIVQYLYKLASNPSVKINDSLIRSLIENELFQVIHALRELPQNLFLLGNIEVLLLPQDKVLIYEELKSLNFEKVRNVRFWRVVLYFIKGDNIILCRIKDAILQSESLWDAGFTKNGGVSRGDFIKLHFLRITEKYPGINWETEEVLTIYNVLLKVLKKINEFQAKHSDREFFNDILEEMLAFLKDNSEILCNIGDYENILENVTSALNRERQFDHPLKGLISGEQNKVLRALDEIVSGIYDFQDWSSSKIYVDILVNKILLQKMPVIEASLDALSFLITEYKERSEFKDHRISLVAILTQYKDYPLENGDQAYIEERLVKIALVLNEWGEKDAIVIYYIELLESSRFNNIKYILANKIKIDIDVYR